MGLIYPRSEYYLSYPEMFNKDSYFAVIVGIPQVGNLLENIVFRKIRYCLAHSFGHGKRFQTPLFRINIAIDAIF